MCTTKGIIRIFNYNNASYKTKPGLAVLVFLNIICGIFCGVTTTISQLNKYLV